MTIFVAPVSAAGERQTARNKIQAQRQNFFLAFPKGARSAWRLACCNMGNNVKASSTMVVRNEDEHAVRYSNTRKPRLYWRRAALNRSCGAWPGASRRNAPAMA